MDGLHKLTLTTELARNLSMTISDRTCSARSRSTRLADFEAGRPSSFSRTLTPRRRAQLRERSACPSETPGARTRDLNLTYRRAHRRQPIWLGPESIRSWSRCSDFATIACRTRRSSPRVGLQQTVVRRHRSRREQSAQPTRGRTATRRWRHRNLRGIAGAYRFMNPVSISYGLRARYQQLTCGACDVIWIGTVSCRSVSVPSACESGEGVCQ